ncbi:MAG: cytochrome P450 [Gemmatimonadaceae bacterium]
MPNASDVPLFGAAFKANPYPVYARLRADEPVHVARLPSGQRAWLLTRYADALAALKDPRLVKDRRNISSVGGKTRQPWMPGMLRPLMENMLDRDPPDHTRLRILVHKAFTPHRIEQLRARIQSITDDLLHAVVPDGRMDLIRDFALPLPAIVIAEMLGIPASDRHRFHRWSARIVAADPSGWRMVTAIPSVLAFLRYLRRLVRSRRRAPGDDLVSALVAAEEQGDQLSEDELVAMIFLLLVAGHETTVNLIGNGVLALLRHPDQTEAARQSLGWIRPAIEELLRYSGPLEMATERYAREDIMMHGVTIPRGALVFAVLASANRDESQFEQAATLQLGRDPNRHLAFGHGAHYCLGATLARLEGAIAIDALLGRCTDLRLAIAPDSLRWRRGLVVRGVDQLPVQWTNAPTAAEGRATAPASAAPAPPSRQRTDDAP